MSDAGRDVGHRHVPVMLDRVLALLDPVAADASAVVVDATIGLGGHAAALLARHPDLRLIGIDRDAAALDRSRATAHRPQRPAHPRPRGLRLAARGARRRRCRARRRRAVRPRRLLDAARRGRARLLLLPGHRPGHADGSQHRADRGRRREHLLGRRSSAGCSGSTARSASPAGSRRPSSASGPSTPLTSSVRLADLVRDAVPAATRRTGGHPAKRTFQALRIEVNDELGALERALPAAVTALRLGGRLVVLAYQSLEDRIVKRTFAAGATSTAPPDLPVVPPDSHADAAAAHPRRRAGRRRRDR